MTALAMRWLWHSCLWRWLVRLEAVSKRYGLRQPWIVRNVTLDVPAGRLIRVEGRNGSGKSTLLRVAAGVSLPSAGGRSASLGGLLAEPVPERAQLDQHCVQLGGQGGLRACWVFQEVRRASGTLTQVPEDVLGIYALDL
jgi:ABC-type transport system involved in cytochrome c biogenesis ATPase subunit